MLLQVQCRRKKESVLDAVTTTKPKKCPAYGQICKVCRRKNQFGRMCKTQKQKDKTMKKVQCFQWRKFMRLNKSITQNCSWVPSKRSKLDHIQDGAAMFGRRPGRSAKTVLLFTFLLIFNSLFAHITSALITYDKSTLLDIGNRFTNLVQDTLSPNPNPSWPLEILRNAENKGHRRRYKKHRGKALEFATDWGKELTVLLYRAFYSLMSNPWIIRWTILEPG